MRQFIQYSSHVSVRSAVRSVIQQHGFNPVDEYGGFIYMCTRILIINFS